MNSVLIANTAVTAKPAKLRFDYYLANNEDLFNHSKVCLTVTHMQDEEYVVNGLIKIIHEILCLDNEFECLSDCFFNATLSRSYLTRRVFFHNLSLRPTLARFDETKLMHLIKINPNVVDFENKHGNSSIEWKLNVSN